MVAEMLHRRYFGLALAVETAAHTCLGLGMAAGVHHISVVELFAEIDCCDYDLPMVELAAQRTLRALHAGYDSYSDVVFGVDHVVANSHEHLARDVGILQLLLSAAALLYLLFEVGIDRDVVVETDECFL